MTNPGVRFEFTNAPPTTLAADISPTDVSLTLTSGDGYATGAIGQFPLVINYGGSTEEIVLCQTRNGTAVTVATGGRGYSGTSAASHSANETVSPCWPATEADADNLHNASSGNVHGISGDVVGTSDVQTLTNKTIDGATNVITDVSTGSVTGLTTLLAGKLATPATAWAKGSLLVGTGAGTYDTLPVGATGSTPVVQADGSLAYAPTTIGSWTNYTPSVTGSTGGTLVIGSGVLSGRYVQVGKTVTVAFYVQWSTTGTASTFTGANGDLQISLPVAPSANAFASANAYMNNAQNEWTSAVLTIGSSVVRIQARQTTGTSGQIPYGVQTFMNAGQFTGAGSADRIGFTLVYEAA